MRILHVSDAYLPKQGGIEMQVHDLALRQARDGHQVAVITCADPGDGAPVGPHPVHRLRTPWGRVRATDARLRQLFTDAQPDVVHAHLSVLSPLSILAVRRAARSGVPVVATLHSLWWFATPLYAIADLLLHWARWPVHWTAVSDLAAQPLRGILRRRADVALLPNGIDPGAWVVDPVERDPREVVVVSVMRLAARKRPRALLRAVQRAADRLPPGVRLRVVVVGDGPQRPRLERDIARLGLSESVELRGGQQRARIRELYRRADLYLAPAVLESFGIAALEARCAGIPVIARAGTGIADFIRNGEHGLLATSDAGLAQALLALAASPQRRAAMSAAALQDVTEWGWDEILQRCQLAYKVAGELADPR